MRALHFLGHGDDHASGRVGVSSVEDTNDPRPARGPARVWLERSEDVARAAAAFLGDGKDGADKSDNANESEVHSCSL